VSRWFTEREEALLEERSRRLSDLHRDQRETERLVVFRRGEAQYGIAAGDLLGVRQMGRITRLPGVPPQLVGLVHLSGKTVGVVDLARLAAPDAMPPAVPWLSPASG
jgi:chemotaxis signal transduction protein